METTPLLSCDEDDNIFIRESNTTVEFELKYIIKNSIPVLVTFIFQYFIQIMIPIYFSSKGGSNNLSAASLAITTFYLTGPVIINGFTSSLDTLCSTAFGADHFRKVGHYYLQCTAILLIMMIPSMLFWCKSFLFFNSFLPSDSFIYSVQVNQENKLESTLPLLASNYLAVMPWAAPAVVIFECTKRFLQAQNKFSIPTKIVFIGMPMSYFLNVLLENHLDQTAPAFSFVLTYWLMALLIISYVVLIDGYQCLPLKSDFPTFKSFFENTSQYFKLGVPGILMILSESLAFQVLTFLSTTFSSDQLAAQSIVATISSLAFQLPFAVGICCCTRVANIIGARSKNYIESTKAITIVTFSLSCFNFLWMVIFRRKIASFFTDDKQLLDLTANLTFLIAINQFLDCFNVICAAVLRSQGRQNIGSILSIFSYYFIGMPLEWLFAFYFDYQVFGLWIGLAIAVNFLSLSEIFIVLKSDWESIIAKNHKMV